MMKAEATWEAVSPRERYAGAVWGALAADALALAPHWIYDPAEIARRWGETADFQAPEAGSYHAGKAAGDQTHYGEQTLVLLESLAGNGGAFVMEDFARRWREWAENAHAYKDHATKETLAHLQEGQGLTRASSGSTELGGAIRIAPLLAALREEEGPVMLGAARAQTALTHGPIVTEAAELLTNAVLLLMRGVSLRGALQGAVALPYRQLPAEEYLRRGIAASERPVVEAVQELGASCDLGKALPSALAILWRHGDDPETALIRNVMAGGDSAARGMFLGTLLGAAHGRRGLPARWIAGLRARGEVEAFLESVGVGGE
jgi:ADP-ribosylglycohydrolase